MFGAGSDAVPETRPNLLPNYLGECVRFYRKREVLIGS